MKGPIEKLNYALNSLEHFLVRTQPIVNTFPPVDNNSPPTIKADPITLNDPLNLPSPNESINIKAEVDIGSQTMEVETPFDPDMDSSDTDSNYASSDSDYSDFEDLEGDFLEARARAYSNIFKHIPPVRHIDPFG